MAMVDDRRTSKMAFEGTRGPAPSCMAVAGGMSCEREWQVAFRNDIPNILFVFLESVPDTATKSWVKWLALWISSAVPLHVPPRGKVSRTEYLCLSPPPKTKQVGRNPVLSDRVMQTSMTS